MYSRKEDGVFYHKVMTNTKKNTNTKTKTKTKIKAKAKAKKVLKGHNMCYIFEKQKVQDIKKKVDKVNC